MTPPPYTLLCNPHYPHTQISWSGCKDSQTSADAQIGGRNTGAMSDVCALHFVRHIPLRYLSDPAMLGVFDSTR